MKTAKEMAVSIYAGDVQAKNELEKMMGKQVQDMTADEKALGVAFLAAFEKYWR